MKPAQAPAGWFEGRLGDLLERIDAGWSPQCEGQPAGEDAWGVLKVSAVSSGRYVETENKALPPNLAPRPEIEVRPGQVLLARASGVIELVGKSVFVRATRPRLMLSDKILRLEPKSGVLSGEYLNALLASQSVRKALMAVTGGSHMRNVSQGALKELVVLCPPLAEQQKIAAILFSVDDAIEATQAVIEQLQIVRKAMVDELLVRGLPSRHSRFKQTEVGEVPEEWAVLSVSQIAAVSYGLTVNAQRRASPQMRPYLTVASVQEEGFNFAAVKQIGVLPGDERYELLSGDVLVVEGNANPDRLGRAFVWRGEISGALHQNHLIRIRSTANDPQWIALAINGAAGRRQILDHAKTSSGLHTINSTVVGNLMVAVPSHEEQRAAIAACAAVNERIERERQCKAALDTLKSALSAALLTGELRVTPDEPTA